MNYEISDHKQAFQELLQLLTKAKYRFFSYYSVRIVTVLVYKRDNSIFEVMWEISLA